MKKLITLIITLLVGFGVGRYSAKTATDQKLEQLKVLTPQINEKIKQLADQELKNYAMAEDAKKKLEAADILYSKVVLLFLADLSLHLDLPQVAKETIWETPTPVATETVKPLPEEANANPLKEMKAMAKTMRAELAPESLSANPASGSGPAGQEKLLSGFKNSSYANKMTPAIRRMIGTFHGTLRLETGRNKGRIHLVVMSFDFLQKGKELDGTSQVEITDHQGIVYSNSSGTGGNSSLRVSPDDPDIIYVSSSPDSFFSINLKTFPRPKAQFFDNNTYMGTAILQKN